jgi:hypothetical protein
LLVAGQPGELFAQLRGGGDDEVASALARRRSRRHIH